jgi:hypothetical protein
MTTVDISTQTRIHVVHSLVDSSGSSGYLMRAGIVGEGKYAHMLLVQQFTGISL